MGNPMYRQIAEELREQIESGALRPGQQLLTEFELRDHYGASRNTIRDAIKWLTGLGLVEAKPGQGTFVVQRTDPFVTTLTADRKRPGGSEVFAPGEDGYGEIDGSEVNDQKTRAVRVTDPQIEVQKADEFIGGCLQVSQGSAVVSRHQRRYIDEMPWSLQTSFYPMAFVTQGAERLIEAGDIGGGVLQYLEDSLGLREAGYSSLITVRSPDATEVHFFKLPPDGRVGLFEILETGFDQTGAPLRVTATVMPTDRNYLLVNMGDVPDRTYYLTKDKDGSER